MRLRIHHPLVIGILGVVAMLVALVIVLVGAGLRTEIRTTSRTELERLLGLAGSIVSRADSTDPHQLVRDITGQIGHRVTLMKPDGTVIADSFVDPTRVPLVENHSDRPEVRAVLSAGDSVGFAERVSETVGLTLTYAAAMSTLDGERVVLRISAPRTDVDASVARVQRSVALAGVLALVIAIGAAYALSATVARPLVTLADRARRLAEGDFTVIAPHVRIGEIHDVSVAFNKLTDELRARLDDLERERDGMETLIDCMAEGVVALTEDGRLLRTNRMARALLDMPEGPNGAPIGAMIRHLELRDALKDSVKQPEQSREIEVGDQHILLASRALDLGGSVTTLLDITELRRMERVRSDFVANASHELKTPLTSIRGYAEALSEDDPPADVRRKFLTSILQNTLRLQKLVDDLLDLSRLESGGWTAKLEAVWVPDAVREAWDLVSAKESQKVQFAVRGEAAVRGDRQGLVHVLRNLLENAVRHAPADGHVRVDIARTGKGTVAIAVIDDGEGIPAQALPRIFERFYRADSARARHIGGTGLGLAIVKHLVGAMDGQVSAQSELGHGTTIRVLLPEA
jgi:signal transduction histidine kinase